MTGNILKIGTRGSKLALVQAKMVEAALKEAHPALSVEIVVIKSAADWKPEHGETRLSESEGGKGLFAREIEQALLDGAVDCGVHSLKDMASFLPEGLVIEHVLPREDVRDAFVSARYESLEDLPAGATVGTCSLRRQAFVLAHRPDIRIVPLRGNVDTRLQKLKDGHVDATILAMAGLKRLGLEQAVTAILEPRDMLPACGQGAVCIETREGDDRVQGFLNPLHCFETGLCVFAERAALQALDGSCHTPIGAYATLDKGLIHLRVLVASPDGQALYYEAGQAEVEGPAGARAFGRDLGDKLKSGLPPGFLA